MEKNKSFNVADFKRELYDALVKSYYTDKDIFESFDNDEQPADKEVTKAEWFKKPERPPTLDPDWKPLTSFDELNDTSFDFSAFVMNRLNIPNLTQEILVGSAFNLLKGTCKSIKRLEYYLEECSKSITERLDWHNPENKQRRIIVVTRLKMMKKYDYGHLEKIEVRRDDQEVYTFKEGDFKRLRLQDIEDMLLLLVQQKLTYLTIDERYDLNVALRIQNWRDLPRDIPLDSVVVLRYEKRSKSENKGKVPTEMELVLEQTQQEHQSDTKVFTTMMEILLEPTSKKLLVGDLSDSLRIKLVTTGKK
nr:hypothetical protein [Tanacetum cinerariifolium]